MVGDLGVRIGEIRVTLPNISGLTTANLNYALNAPAVGTNFPLAVDGANVTAATTSSRGTVMLKAPTQTRYTSGSGTYVVPNGVLYLKVKMVGGGGGGGGSSTNSAGTSGSSGGTTTFGTSLLTCNGGTGGSGPNTISGAPGGTATIGSGAVGVAISGNGSVTLLGPGSFGSQAYLSGPPGGSSVFGGVGQGSTGTSSAAANSGSGGNGGGTQVTAAYPGVGGGAGGYIDALISAPLVSYAYSVGAGGTGGAAGTSGYAGGNGGSGIIIIEEYYY